MKALYTNQVLPFYFLRKFAHAPEKRSFWLQYSLSGLQEAGEAVSYILFYSLAVKTLLASIRESINGKVEQKGFAAELHLDNTESFSFPLSPPLPLPSKLELWSILMQKGKCCLCSYRGSSAQPQFTSSAIW